MKKRNGNHRPITVNEPAAPPPAGFSSWQEFRDELWNAGLRQPGTRVFKIVGEELREITAEEAVAGEDGPGTRVNHNRDNGLEGTGHSEGDARSPVTDDCWHLSFRDAAGNVTYESLSADPDEITAKIDGLLTDFSEEDIRNCGGREAIEQFIRVFDRWNPRGTDSFLDADELEGDDEDPGDEG